MKKQQKHLRELVARAAARQLTSYAPRERADLLEGIALLLGDAGEQELARHTVALMRQSEEHQAKVVQMLNGGAGE
jgi:hypothetical protein